MTYTVDNEPAETTAAMSAPASDPTANLWACIAPPLDRIAVTRALLGLDGDAVRYLAATELLASPTAGSLVSSAPGLLDQPGFPHGHHQLAHELVASLRTLVTAGRALDLFSPTMYDDEQLRHARSNAAAAEAVLAEPVLLPFSGVSAATHSPEAGSQAPAVVNDSGLTLETVLGLVDRRTRAQHAALLAVLAIANDIGISPQLTVADGIVWGQGFVYRHPGVRGSDAPAGIRLGSLLIDVPDFPSQSRPDAWNRLRARAGTHQPVVVYSPEELMDHAELIAAQLRS